MDKRLHPPPFTKKGDFRIAKNYRDVTLTSLAGKIFNTLLLNRIEPEMETILKKNQNGLRRNRSTICRFFEGVRVKNLEAILLLVNFSKAFDSRHREKMEQILLANGLPKETVTAIMTLYKNAKVKVCSPDGNTVFFCNIYWSKNTTKIREMFIRNPEIYEIGSGTKLLITFLSLRFFDMRRVRHDFFNKRAAHFVDPNWSRRGETKNRLTFI